MPIITIYNKRLNINIGIQQLVYTASGCYARGYFISDEKLDLQEKDISFTIQIDEEYKVTKFYWVLINEEDSEIADNKYAFSANHIEIDISYSNQ